jgi:GPN-loop GTPase
MASSPVLLIIGMAGSGKTAFTQRAASHLHSQQKTPFLINLDPAVLNVPYSVDIDIRDSIHYKEIMER